MHTPKPRYLALRLIPLALLLALLAACGGSPAATSTPGTTTGATSTAGTTTDATSTPGASTGDPSKFLVFGNSGEPDSLDTMDTTTGTALIVAQQIQENLIDFKPGTVDLQPGLATEWTSNESGTEWTFKLRPGVTFHDGTPFNADAVVFNFRRLAEADFEFGFRGGEGGKQYAIFPDIFGAYKGEPNSLWQDIVKVDDSTVKIMTTSPLPYLPNMLAGSYFGISSPEAVKKAGAKYGTPEGPVAGTGPFKLLEWRPGESVTLERYEGYWGEKARMPGVVFRSIPEAADRWKELQAGSIDFTTNLTPDVRTSLTGGFKDVSPEPFNVAYLSLDMTVKPLDDPKVRQAIAHAIDKKAILEAFYGNVGTVASDFLPDGLAWARPDSVQEYAYDPAKAKALLTEAGYPDGFSTMVLTDGTELPLELWYMPVSRPYYPTPKPIAEVYSSYLADVGIKAELKTEDWSVYLDNWDAGKKHGLVMLGWTGDYGDPNNFLFTHFGPGNLPEAGYNKPEIWEKLRQAGSIVNLDEAAKVFKEAGTQINLDLPRIPIVHSPPVYAAKQGLEGWLPNPTGGESFASIFIQK